MDNESDLDPRRLWESRWNGHRAEDFGWHLREAPPELRELLDGGRFPAGAAVDLGCGGGVAAVRMARSFRPTVGLDIASGAVHQARDRARSEGVEVAFVLAEAPFLPLGTGTCAFVFDRGCFQQLRRRWWRTYFSEVTRVLRSEGMLQLYVARPSGGSVWGRAFHRLGAVLGRIRGKAVLASERTLRGLLPPELELLERRDIPYRGPRGPQRTFLYALVRRR